MLISTHIDDNQIDANENDYLFIAQSQIINSGQGLFTAIKIYKDEIISVFKGEILSSNQAANFILKGLDNYFMDLFDGTTLDCQNTFCFAKFANDAAGLSKSNFKNNAKITLDENGNVCLVALKCINPNEEIFCNYGKKYWKNKIK